MMQPDVSIIVPIHNSEKYIEECINSAVCQSYKNIEIICVGGSGEDNSETIVKKYQKEDDRVRLILDKNGSYGHKINVGMQNANGRYVGILESDDSLPYNAIQILLEPTIYEDYDYVDGDYFKIFDIRGQRYQYRAEKYRDILCKDKKLEGKEALKSGVESEITANWTALYRKEFLEKYEIWHQESPGASFQDVSFRFLVIAMAKKTYHISQGVYNYRIDNEHSSVKSKSKVFAIYEEYEYIKRFLQKKNCTDQEIWDYYYLWKYRDYYWNLTRLDDKERNDFLKTYVSELEDDLKKWKQYNTYITKERWKYLVLPLRDKEMLLNDIRSIQSYSVVEHVRRIIDMAENKEIVIVGCGVYGRRLLEIFSKREKVYACDNDFFKCGKNYQGIWIESMDEVVEKHTKAIYVISSSKYFEELKSQVLSRGISPKQIVGL